MGRMRFGNGRLQNSVYSYFTNYALMTAGCVILIVPQLTIFTIFQRYIIDGVTAGAVKG